MMVLPKELETEIKERLRHVSKPFDLIPIWKLAGKNMHPIDARDCFSCYRRYENPPEAFFEHLTSFSVEEKEWRHRLDESTDPQEIIELGKKLEMDMDMESAEIIADCNRGIIERRKENGRGDVVQEIEEMLVKWMGTTDKQEFITIGLQLDSDATEDEMAELFDNLKTTCRRKEVDRMEEKKVTDSSPEKLEWTDSEIMDYAVQLFLDSLPSLDEKEENKSEKESPNKGISQEAINTLLDLSLTTEEALNKSAEITIREQDKPEGEVL